VAGRADRRLQDARQRHGVPLPPATEFSYLVGSHEPDAVLVVDPDGQAVLYQAPSMDRSTPAFFTDRVYGELWVGPRPTLAATSALLGIATRPLEELTKLSGAARVVRGYDARVEGCSRPTRPPTPS
jgi:Xaa-Pro aminopeptidase